MQLTIHNTAPTRTTQVRHKHAQAARTQTTQQRAHSTHTQRATLAKKFDKKLKQNKKKLHKQNK